MASHTTVTRYRPALIVLGVLAAGYGIYYVHSSRQASSELTAGSRRLHRSNAVLHRRSRRTDDRPREASEYPRSTYNAEQLLEEFRSCPDPLTTFRFDIGINERGVTILFEIPLSPSVFPSLEYIKEETGVEEERAEDIRQNYEAALMKSFLCQRLPPNCSLVDPGGPEAFLAAFEAENFIFEDSILQPISQFNSGTYEYLDERRAAYENRGFRPPVRRRLRNGQDASETVVEPQPSSPPQAPIANLPEGELSIGPEDFALQAEEMDVDDESENSFNGDENDESRREGQSLLNLLYHIAEDQARREGIVHRGVSCNSCNATPIHGIRYRCTNCVDYDLCEQCEAMQFHSKNHVFMKIRIPTPTYSSSRRPQPVSYPGNAVGLPNNMPRDLNKNLTETTGFSDNEIDALWDQFKTLAVEDWPDDPDQVGWAIDRAAFDKCFVFCPRATQTPPTSLIYDRMFAFYDTNHDGLVGLREFVAGLAAARSKDPDERHKRTFNGFDYDGDGYVSRKDLLLMFRSHYALQREFTRELVADMEADLLEGGSLRDNIDSNQPISAAYQGTFSGERGHAGEGKSQDAFGDLIIVDNQGAIAEDSMDESDPMQMIADLREVAQFGTLSDEEPPVIPPTHVSAQQSDEADQIDRGGVFTESGLDEIPLSDVVRAVVAQDSLAVEPAVVDPPASETSSDWPPAHLADRDVERALGRSLALRDVTNASDRTKVLEAARNRIKAEEERPRRQQAREAAVRDRIYRRQFYLDDEQKVLDSEAIQRQVSQTAANATTGQSKQSLSSNEPASEPTVDVPKPPFKSENPARDALPVQEPATLSFREPPPLPKNVGQEILYQITQESMNELLDPVFKFREDLAMENIQLQPLFELYKDHVSNFRQGKMDDLCKKQISRIQSQWRSSDSDSTLMTITTPEGRQRVIITASPEGIQQVIKNQWDADQDDYTRNLVDMLELGIIDQETFTQKISKKKAAGFRKPNPASQTSGPSSDPQPSDPQIQDEEEQLSRRQDPVESTEPPPASSQEEEPSATSNTTEQSSEHHQAYPPAAVELQRSVEAFNSGASNIEESIRGQDLSTLLHASGYSIAEPRPDPTLPQNRPSTVPEPSSGTTLSSSQLSFTANNGAVPDMPLFSSQANSIPPPPPPSHHPAPNSTLCFDPSVQVPTHLPPSPDHPWRGFPPDDQSQWTDRFTQFIKYLSMMMTVAEEDEMRGGPGRLSWPEYEEVVKGQKGSGLVFLGGWVDWHAL